MRFSNSHAVVFLIGYFSFCFLFLITANIIGLLVYFNMGLILAIFWGYIFGDERCRD